MNLIDGKKLSQIKSEELNLKLYSLPRKLGLAILAVGKDDASLTYINQKIKKADSLGINTYIYQYDNIIEEELINKIEELNNNDEIDGIIVQLPLPSYLDKDKILNSIDIKKDIDGLNINSNFIPCTPKGILDLIDYYDIDLTNKNILIIGRSNLVGMPLYKIFKGKNLNVTMAHSRTENIKDLTLKADIIIIAIGKERYLKDDMIKDGAIVFDVGINYVDGILCGDADFENIKNKVSMITPVPGGIGPMTVYEIFDNLLTAYKN
ncbi:MAG: bifunctional 5,10-methylenetetrahydrofolate dehydrogenase/5,10-methenyltetrahydrofolate cyclohydrolase [Bacilli bacterium]|nr:bifunctional 5,10-methylenetetrahydrofolate dehydrogenase/5,10-methenyltetrahydrofolate cyclohydrolase [Bacilli bacterium]